MNRFRGPAYHAPGFYSGGRCRETQRPRTLLALSAAVLIACAGSRAEAPRLPDDTLPGEPGPLVELDADGLAADATDPAQARTFLDGSGFAAGNERTWVDPQRGVRAVVRLLVFDGSAGARTHLNWICDHAHELIGEAKPSVMPEAPDGATVFVHEPSGCCPKETPAFLVPWRKGAMVVWLEVRGPRVRPRDVVDLALRLDAAV